MIRVLHPLRGTWVLLLFCVFAIGATGRAPPPRSVAPDEEPSDTAAAQWGPSTVTAPNGAFRFTGLERGTHQLTLQVSSLPIHLRPPADAPRVSLWLTPGQSLVSEPIAGRVRFSAVYDVDGATITGYVFLDTDGDGHMGPTDVGLAGVTVVDPTVHQYFVPFDDDDLWTLFAEINDNDPGIGQCLFNSSTSTTLVSFISLTSSSDGTEFFYDHWEDGYDADPFSPGPTTEVGVIDTGVTRLFNNSVTTPRTPSPLLYDGRDLITIFGERATVIRAVYPAAPGERLAGAWEVPEVSDWGQRYTPVIGEDIDVNGMTTDDFDYVGLEIMAAYPDTEIWINGQYVTTTLEVGTTVLVEGENDGPGGGGINSTDVISATGPIQVQVLGAACVAPFSARAYTLQPIDVWTTDYWAPVPDFAESSWCDIDQDGSYVNDRDTDIYVHNVHPYPITVMLDDGVAGAIPLAVPANATISVMATLGRDLSDTVGAHLYSDETFWGVSAIDSTSGSSADSDSQRNDWGYSLIPVDRLSSRVVLGWSPGNSLVPPNRDPRHNSGNLAFVSAFTDTVIFVDLYVEAVDENGFVAAEAFDINGDGDANDFDVFGNDQFDEPRSDDGIRLRAGEVLRVADPNDNDLTGAVIYTADLAQKIAVAWGQDPCRSEQREPYLDLGYTVLAAPIPSLSKQADLSLEADLTGTVSPGQTVTYTIVMRNNGLGPMFNGVLTDTLPYTHTDYVVGSLAVIEPPYLGSRDFFNGETGSWGYTPVATPDGLDPAAWALRLDWPFIGPGATVTGTLRVQLDDDIPREAQEVCNHIIFCSDETGCVSTEVCTPIGRPLLELDKVSEPDSVRPGDVLTYTVVATNTGDGIAFGTLVVDDLPPFVAYQPGTLRLTLPAVVGRVVTQAIPVTTSFNGSFADDFDLTSTQTSGFAGSDGVYAWSSDWIEGGDPVDPGPLGGDVRVGSVLGADLSLPGYLELSDSDDIVASVTRALDLTDFFSPTLRFFVSGINDPGGDFQVIANGDLLLSERYSGPYVRRVLDLSAYAGSAATLGFRVAPSVEAGQSYRFDNIRVVESSPLRTAIRTYVDTIAVLTYTTLSNVDPVAYDLATNILTVTDRVRIPPTAYVHFSFQVKVSSPLTDGLYLINRATITSTNVFTNPQDSTTTPVVSSHALTVTKTGDPPTVYVGERITYAVFWEVGGDEPAPGVIVTDTIPWPYVSFVGCEGGLSCTHTAPDTVVWELGDLLPPGSGIEYASGWLTLTVRAERYPPNGIFTNTVILDDATDTPPDEDSEDTRVRDAGFVLDKRRITPSPVKVGDPVQFSIAITNAGALSITRLPLMDMFDPVYLRFEGATLAPQGVSADRLTWNDLVDGTVLPPGGVIRVVAAFEALTSTQHLNPPLTIDIAESAGAQTVAGALPRLWDQADVGILGPPTAIALLYLNATPKADGVLLAWATLFEVDTFGFWTYRSEGTKIADAIPISFIPAKGWGGLGAVYQVHDVGLPPGKYFYWLKEVDNAGIETTYGPVSAWSGWHDGNLPNRFYLPVITK